MPAYTFKINSTAHLIKSYGKPVEMQTSILSKMPSKGFKPMNIANFVYFSF